MADRTSLEQWCQRARVETMRTAAISGAMPAGVSRYNGVMQLAKEAWEPEAVDTVSQTLYRVCGDAPFIYSERTICMSWERNVIHHHIKSGNISCGCVASRAAGNMAPQVAQWMLWIKTSGGIKGDCLAARDARIK